MVSSDSRNLEQISAIVYSFSAWVSGSIAGVSGVDCSSIAGGVLPLDVVVVSLVSEVHPVSNVNTVQVISK